MRPVCLSVNRIGSKLSVSVPWKLLFSQVARAGTVESSKVMRRVCRPAMNIARPDFQFTPIEGSPELLPRLPGAAKL